MKEQFEKHFKSLDFSKTKDAWGREIYAHSHVQALWDGWSARALEDKAVDVPDHTEMLREAVEMLEIVKRLIGYGPDYAIIEGSAYDKMLITTITKINTALGKETP